MTTNSEMLIKGKKVTGQAATFDVLNPATEEVVASCHAATEAQLNGAISAAQDAFTSWQYTSDEDRKAMLHQIADKIEANAAELAEIVVHEQGKPMFLAQAEVGGAVAWTRYAAELDIPVEVIEDTDTKRIEVQHKPLGVVGSITPWNWPLMIAIWHIAPALRAGNTVVCKPSELTPLNTLRLIELMNEVLPAGVVNVVLGGGEIGGAMSEHQGINKIIFTGSTPTGQKIMRSAASNLKRLTLELGGNDAGIILPDSNIDAIAEGIFQTAFLNMGQTCAALKRLYVHDSQYDEVCQKLAAISEAQIVGHGLHEGTTFGPVQNRMQLNKVIDLVEDAKQNGAKVLCGGAKPEGAGYFFPPTIIAEVTNGMRIVDEEQFGPVLPVIRYSDVDQAVEMANSCSVGLGGSVWSADVAKAQQVAQKLECGTAWVNGHAEVLPHAPFGGCKMSGFGVEFGQAGLLGYTQPQTININK
ncbi:aldehyde dehydrogenase family protein [Oceanospirillum linum]|uniref:Aldehyde dehydrogenase n=1 Tax=Oceanospirillum linum TaxID=966 RepID=A0A1T1HDI1_OCELI|nr:aldehyde dehydrogenase family protein [Oceanospirillum linum]OOV87876.1 aldehyde dehydrogenase [Oceanospirillum linum]SEG09326.1 Acyl-CoA reductase [Oleiphilus messinensis]SMP08557.1 Acyl-CoA reductase [Oceanospirillum linum]